MPTRDQWMRLGLWGLLLNTANANRLAYGLPTTWVPHTLGNTLGLALPEIVDVVDVALGRVAPGSASLTAVRAAVQDVTSEPRGWTRTMAPVTLAYVASHPNFNIYRGRMGELRWLGFGLDSIPHSLTAAALTTLVYDGLTALRRRTPSDAAIAPVVEMAYHDRVALAAVFLASLTLFYEYSEYSIHQQELQATDGDVTKINMMWDAEDTVKDIASNTLGWLGATVIHLARAQRATRTSAAAPA